MAGLQPFSEKVGLLETMKKNMKIPLILSLIIAMTACQSSNEVQKLSPPPATVEGTWKLERMIMGWTNKEVSAETLEYEEFYTFKGDSTFTKYRTNGESASGRYSTGRSEEGFFVKTFYAEETGLRESCSAEGEYLLLKDSGVLEGGSLPCDGPAFFYEKTDRLVD